MHPIIFFGQEILINPVAFQIGKVKIYWYGIIVMCAVLLCLVLIKKRKDKWNIKYDDILDFAVGALFLGFICARIYYVLFNLDYYLEIPLEIFFVWHGGIAIYGGIIGTILYGIYFCKKRKIIFLDLADLLIPYLSLAQSIGRWGNFINQEAYGYETNKPWKMGIYSEVLDEYIYVHPTFLYESLCTLIIFFILLKLSKDRKFSGQIFCMYMILYGTARAVIEGLRTDSLMFANFRVSQVLSILFVVSFVIIYFFKRSRRLKNIS